MARKLRSSVLETRTGRLKLPKRGKPYWIRIDRGLSLGYRRIETAGPWIIRKSTGTGGNWIKNFAIADDFEESNGEHVLTFWQAQDKARAVAHGRESDGGKPGTVAEAIVRYADNLKAEGGNVYNARMARIHLPPTILQKPVALLTGKELRHWRDSLLEGRARSSVNRIIVTLSSGLELAADLDPRITNRSAWKIGLKKLAGADVGRARNIVLPEPTVVRVVTLGYAQSHAFGLFIETKAVTGARRVQLARLTVADLQDDRPDPRLMMPSAVKGKRGKRRVDRVPVPITASLAGKLRVASAGRPPSALLLVKPDGTAWGANDPRAPFRAVAIAAGLDPNTATPYCLRHTSITRQLLAGVPVQIVSDSHDTSPLMISAHYASSITSHSDAISRRALPDFGATAPGAEVVVRQGRRA